MARCWASPVVSAHAACVHRLVKGEHFLLFAATHSPGSTLHGVNREAKRDDSAKRARRRQLFGAVTPHHYGLRLLQQLGELVQTQLDNFPGMLTRSERHVERQGSRLALLAETPTAAPAVTGPAPAPAAAPARAASDDECTFTFVLADKIRSCGDLKLAPLQELRCALSST